MDDLLYRRQAHIIARTVLSLIRPDHRPILTAAVAVGAPVEAQAAAWMFLQSLAYPRDDSRAHAYATLARAVSPLATFNAAWIGELALTAATARAYTGDLLGLHERIATILQEYAGLLAESEAV